jgi:hypothetical protein
MRALKDFARGLTASFSGQALVALGWAYAACLAVGFVFTLMMYRFVAGTVAGSAMASDLRQGQSAGWSVDQFGRPGTSTSVAMLVTAAMVLAPVYLVLVVFFSGGVVAKVRAALGLAGPERFLSASARYAGVMARVASVEVIVVGVLGGILLVGMTVGDYADLGNAFAWSTLALSMCALALVTSVFDYARIGVVASDNGSALAALRGAVRFVGQRALPVVFLAALNGALALAVAWLLVWAHSVVSLDTGAGMLLGLVVGQVGVLGRLWSRVVAYAAETSLWEQASPSEG